MADTVETVMIHTTNGTVVINRSDYNPNLHMLVTDTQTTADEDEEPAVVADLFEPPAASSVEPHEHTDATGDIVPATDQETAPVDMDDTDTDEGDDDTAPLPAETRYVSKIGSKYFIINELGQKVVDDSIDPKGYKTEDEAHAALG